MGAVNRCEIRILVTGSSGLVAGRLIQHLSQAGHYRIRAASRVARVWPSGVEGCVTEIEKPETLDKACENIEALVQLAAMPERECAADPQRALRANAGGTLAWALAAARAGVTRFVQASTYKVYGDNPSGRITEETPCAPRSHYAITHRAAEDYVRTQHPSGVVLRLSNGFGVPANDADGAWRVIVNEMCRQAARERRIVIRSSGLAWRNFVPLADVVGALTAAAGDLPSGTYQVGSAESMTLLGAAERIAGLCGETLGFVPAISVGQPAVEERHEPLDYRIDKLVSSGFSPSCSFADEVRRTLLMAS